jgi:hypothetical protein
VEAEDFQLTLIDGLVFVARPATSGARPARLGEMVFKPKLRDRAY